MNITARTTSGSVSLPSPVSLRLEQDEDAPADSFQGVFPLYGPIGALTGITVTGNSGQGWFDGIVDEQSESLESSGIILKVSARSRAALLLDNEALPQNYINPSLKTVFERHIAPYGFSGFSGDSRVYTGGLKISKGMSEWQAAALFCSRFLGTVPRIRGNVFDASGQKQHTKIRFASSGGIRFSSAEVLRRPCALYSELNQVKTDGSVTLAAIDKKAEALGVRRRRFVNDSKTDAAAILDAAEKKAFAVRLVCPGELSAEVLTPATADIPGLGVFDSLYVSSVSYRISSGGERCQLTLRRN